MRSPDGPVDLQVNGCRVHVVRSRDSGSLHWADHAIVLFIGKRPGGASRWSSGEVKGAGDALVLTVEVPWKEPSGGQITVPEMPALVHQILEGVTDVLQHREGPPIAARLEPIAVDDAVALLEHLTAKERQVLNRLMDGRTAQEMAKDLYISVPTVRGHIQSIFQKLHVTTQLAAVVMAYKVEWSSE
jgi:DNA-binding CsgD family transcriptional regulator